MKNWEKWPDRARIAKERAGKSDAEIAAAINELSDRKAGRAQVNHWFTGKREPTLSQFMLLCSEIDADPQEILFGVIDINTNSAVSQPTRTPSLQQRSPKYRPSKT